MALCTKSNCLGVVPCDKEFEQSCCTNGLMSSSHSFLVPPLHALPFFIPNTICFFSHHLTANHYSLFHGCWPWFLLRFELTNLINVMICLVKKPTVNASISHVCWCWWKYVNDRPIFTTAKMQSRALKCFKNIFPRKNEIWSDQNKKMCVS